MRAGTKGRPQPSTRTQRTLATRYLQYRSPQQLITDAAALVPDHTVWRVTFMAIAHSRASVNIEFYSTASEYAEGINTSVRVVLRREDVPAMAVYLLRLC